MLKFDDALTTILNHISPVEPRRIPLEQCLGLTLAEDVFARENIPCYDNSAMDGYAVRTEDLASAGAENPVSLRVLACVPAGQEPPPLVEPSAAIKTMTGGMIPQGANAVVPVEHVEESGDTIVIKRPAKANENIRPAGEDLREGELALHAGTELNPYRLGLLAAIGAANPLVYPPVRVGVLTTGSELVPIEASLKPGRVRDSVSIAVSSQLREIRAVPIVSGTVADVQAQVESRLLELAQSVDAVITAGAISMGDYDCVRPALEKLGEIIFWKAAIRPGSPFLFGKLLGKPFFGLPGNPTSAMVTFEVFARPALLKMMGRTAIERPTARAICDARIKDREGRRSFVRGVCAQIDGVLGVKPIGPQGSGLHKSMAEANCLIVIPEDTAELEEGRDVEVILLGK